MQDGGYALAMSVLKIFQTQAKYGKTLRYKYWRYTVEFI